MIVGALWLLLLGAGIEDARDRGERAYRSGDLAGALTAWSEGLAAAREAEDRAAEFDLLLRLAAVNRQLGRLEMVQKTLDLAQPLADDSGRARLTLDRGLLAMARGDLKSAEAAFSKAFSAHQELESPADAGIAALDLGLARAASGQFAQARKAFGGAQTLFAGVEDHGGIAAVQVELARLDRREGLLQGALARCEDAVGEALLGGDAQGVEQAQLLRGALLRDLGRPEAAKASYRAALEGAKKRKDVRTQARLYNALGGLLHGSGDPAAASHYATAEEGFAQIGDTASALAVAVNAARLDGTDVAEVRGLLKRASQVGDVHLEAVLALNLAALGDGSQLGRAGKLVDRLGLAELVWRHRYLSGRLALERGKTKDGIARLKQAVDELERRRRGLDSEESEIFVTTHTDVYEALIDALLDSGDSKGAFLYAQRLQLVELPAARDPRLEALVAEEAFLSKEVVAARDPVQQALLTKRLAELRVRFAATVDTLRSTYDDFDRVVRVDPEDLEAIQGDLPEGVAVLQPLLFDDRIALLVFTRDRLEAREVEVDGAEVRKHILRLSRSLQAAHTRDLAWTQGEAETLGAWFLDPIADMLEGIDVLAVSASGPLRELPFGLLRRDGRYLVQDMAVVGVTHVGSLAARSTPFVMSPEQVLLIGNPDGSLPGAETEVARIRARLPEATALIGDEGTRVALLHLAPGKQVIHLATHGVLDRDRPNQSYLVLHGEGESGRLAYQEIPGLAPVLTDCRMVVLSACQSGLPVDAKRPTDPEGGIVVSINGLASQFRRAGVETLLASLWRVDDEGTLALMTGMYDELASGSDVATSLRRAQLRLLASEEHSHPWYWAGFVVVGDWR